MADTTVTINKFDVSKFTNNAKVIESDDYDFTWVVTGEGTFDKMMECVSKHLIALRKSNAIRAEDYATFYCDVMKATMNAALQADSQAADAALKRRQVQGFNEKYKTDMLKIMLDAWTVGFSASEDAFYSEETAAKAIPTPITSDEINDMWNKYMKGEFDEPISLTRAETLEEETTETSES